MSNANAVESDFMSLAPGIGVIPEKYRNRGYRKLHFGPGEGGLGDSQPQRKTDGLGMQEFLAGIAAGADPKEFAAQLLSNQSTGRPRARKGT